MSKIAQYLKPAWVQQQFDLAKPLLPEGVGIALWVAGKCLGTLNADSASLNETTSEAKSFTLTLDGNPVGALLLSASATTVDCVTRSEEWAISLVHTLQKLLEAEHARRAVTQETLESYREMAMLQRAVTDLNLSMKPASVAAALLKEFDIQKGGAEIGAVFLRAPDAEAAQYDLIASFGPDAEPIFDHLSTHPLFARMLSSQSGDILDELADEFSGDASLASIRSLLWLPLIAQDDRLGLLVLAAGQPDRFSSADMKRALTLATVAATALRNAQLYAAEQKMFHAFVRVIATAVDAKSSYTAGHCRRVPEIAMMLADAAHQTDAGPLASFALDEDDRNALQIAALLHDCGKVATPEWVVDKSTKLHTLANRFDFVAMRFEVMQRDAWLDYQQALAEGGEAALATQVRDARLAQIRDDQAFVAKCNRGAEFVSDEDIARLRDISTQCWRDAAGVEHPLLSEDELYNLSIRRGTLNTQERKTIEDHAVHTLNMLSQIPFPPSLRNVTEYAAGHHERMDGKGYPRQLTGDQLSIPARIVAIADIFEALTAPDRPYRKAGTLSWALQTMKRMKEERHIDGDLFDLFVASGVPLEYARKYLTPAQIDVENVQTCLA